MVFCFVLNFFFGQHELEYFFLSRQARNFFPEFNIRLYDKNSESDYLFFLHHNQNIVFSNIGNQHIFLEKNHGMYDHRILQRIIFATVLWLVLYYIVTQNDIDIFYYLYISTSSIINIIYLLICHFYNICCNLCI